MFKFLKRPLVFLLMILLPLTLISAQAAPLRAEPPPPATLQIDENAGVELAIREAMAASGENVLALVLYEVEIDQVMLSQDGEWASAWLILKDPESGEVLPTEPGLVLLQRDGESWDVSLPAEEDRTALIQAAPADLLTDETRETWLLMEENNLEVQALGPFGGYYLPWAGGETTSVSQTVAHDRYTPSRSAHYAFDFYISKVMFNVHAAKTGTVKHARWSCRNGDENCSNWLVLEDTTTSPTTYQLYLHLAQDSIPPELRTVGALAMQGQFLGLADDTGPSSGHHLHFQVHTNPTSYWGTSVDITFNDVAINGGRPRITVDLPYCRNDNTYKDVCNETQTKYVSGNKMISDKNPPRGEIMAPLHGVTVTTSKVRLEGWAADFESGIGNVQFIAKYNGAWQAVGEPFKTDQFSMDWDLCASNIPDGPVSLALEIRDRAGNQAIGLPGLRHFTKKVACPTPPPQCVPTSNQVALFSQPDYGGSCLVLGTGNYANPAAMGTTGKAKAASIQVGANVMATLFLNNSYQGRGETFTAHDSYLYDNVVHTDEISSLMVQLRTAMPGVPVPVWPTNNQIFSNTPSLNLVWANAGGATEYQARLIPSATETLTTEWQKLPFWNLGSLAPGNYTWQIRGRNGAGTSAWSTASAFTVQAPALPGGVALTLPFSDTMENGYNSWQNSSLWDQTDSQNRTPGGAISWRYGAENPLSFDTGAPNSGDLTSPLLEIPASGEYFLRFWYLYETEGPGALWDQRWVQISVGGGPFTNILQLKDDPENFWLQSPAISLKAYAGQTIRVRFHFASLDQAFNAYRGWHIDDFSITATPPPACAQTNEPNDTPAQATAVTYNTSTSGVICPSGDIDFYKFNGTAGDKIGIAIDAHTIGTALDPSLFLLDSDGQSVLAENDDRVHTEIVDSFLVYVLPRSGTFYIKVRAWDHPSVGGSEYSYKLRLLRETGNPTAAITFPKNGSLLPTTTFPVTVSASDSASGISRVVFFWHRGDWLNTDWVLLGEDWDGSDGWIMPFDAKNVQDPWGNAFYAKVYDWSGNWVGVGSWNLTTQPPKTYLPIMRKLSR